MPGLILAAMVIGTLSFESKKEGDQVTVIPMVTLPVECQCEVSMETERLGASGTSRSRQKSVLVIHARRPQALATLILTPAPGDNVVVTVRVSDGRDIDLSETWTLDPQKT
ncbi:MULTISPECIES: curli assembly chaperone CsgC [unclassified Pseudocitrobacter]|uniref:curli assembly chaperone CsgC n=1 Tax=unclassified Pseudocitrobacter TaxID=2638778 RepID=UPI0023E471A3|nr:MULTISPECIES: curli assembly chaperone CsgC [unclassified Pseudocitrobacter]MDF3827920.1 curli assembly chaperone CsgC [Pseudocitrobacter sp. 2023EL-00150]MEC5373534.1 curli assembly chaperone CsgC [Pseudocitrobacter sp. MW920760]